MIILQNLNFVDQCYPVSVSYDLRSQDPR